MIRSRTDKVLNLATATLVLLAGFYVLLFIPLRISGMVKVMLGILLIIYYLWRVKYVNRKKTESAGISGRETANNKLLDK